jgi:hypothetical protein
MRRALFLASEHEDPGRGLVDLAVKVFTPVCSSAPSDMSLSWVLLAFLLSTIFLETVQYLQNSFCFALQIVASKLSPDAHPPVLIPAHARQAQFYYVNQSSSQKGTSSLLEVYNPNRVEQLTSGHAYFSLITTIQTAHSLGNVLEPAFILDFQRSTVYQSSFIHSATPRSWEILRAILNKASVQNLPAVLHPSNICDVKIDCNVASTYPHPIGVYNLIFWSDSFEAFSTKQNRGSIWVLFCSIATPSSSGAKSSQNTFNSGQNTFLIAIGPSGREFSHECVWVRLLQDLRYLNRIQKPLVTYSRFHQKELHSIFPVYVFLQDTPERTDSNGLASWKSNTNVIYGHTAPVVRVQTKLPSCQSCLHRRLLLSVTQTQPRFSCPHCYDWTVPDLVPITYQSLIDAVGDAKAKHFAGGFPNRGAIVTYLRGAGISPTVAKDLASQIFSSEDCLTNLITPCLWQYGEFVDVNDSIEVVMHLLFLGIVRSLAKDVVYPFLSARKQWTSYVDRVKKIMQRISKLHIPWLVLQPIGISGSFGGWVSENYLGYCRVAKYLGALTESLPSHDEPYQDPNVTPSRMSLSQLQNWLTSRNLRVTKPSLQSRARKVDYLATVEATGWMRPGDHPLIVANPKEGMPLSLFERVIVSCHSMVCSIMAVTGIPNDVESHCILREIKLYLSFDHQFDTWKPGNIPGTPEPWDHLRGSGTHYPVLTMNTDPLSRHSRMTSDPFSAPNVISDCEDEEEEDDLGSISDSSGDGLPQDEILLDGIAASAPPPEVVLGSPASYRIAAVRKRNKINLLKVPSILQRVGSYHYVVELGPKGEGAIQTVKPVVKKFGGISKPLWASHVARAWSSRKYSRNAISLVVDALKKRRDSSENPLTKKDHDFLTSVGSALNQTALDGSTNPSDPAFVGNGGTSILDVDEEIWGNLLDAVCTGKELPKKRMYCIYKSKAAAISAFSDEVDPLSVVVVEPTEEEGGSAIWFAMVFYDQSKQLRLLRLEPATLTTERCGCAFFRWKIADSHNVDPPLMASLSCQDYALLLPLDATDNGSTFVVYYCITYSWKEMIADQTIQCYSYTT